MSSTRFIQDSEIPTSFPNQRLSKSQPSQAKPSQAMGDKIVGVLVGRAFDWIKSEVSRASTVEDDLHKLRATADRIRALLADAEQRRRADDERLLLWLRDLRALALDADDLFDEFHTRERLRRRPSRKRSWYEFSFSRPQWVESWVESWNMAIRILEIRNRYEMIARDRQSLRLETKGFKTRTAIRRDPPFSSSLHGESMAQVRQREKGEIVELLTSYDSWGISRVPPVIAIVGVGGIGKTTLARFVFRDSEVENYFGLRIWVGLGRVLDAVSAMKKIVEVVAKKECSVLSSDLLQHQLRMMLSKKKFLLVLDDVWNEDGNFWQTLRVPLLSGVEGSKVLVTTRGKVVVSNLQPVHQFQLEALSEEECLLLFREGVFGQGALSEDSNLMAIGRDIVRRCGGSPLAVKSVSGHLRYTRDEQEWCSILEDISASEGDVCNTLPTFKVSYDNLASHLKQCFASCSIFPDGYEFDKNRLIRLWMAAGFVKPTGRRRLEDIGARYFTDLLHRSFFQASYSYQNDKQTYKMPTVIHDLARFACRFESVRVDCDGVQHGESGRAIYGLLCENEIKPFTFEKIYQNKRLRALVLHSDNEATKMKIPHELPLNLRCLRILDLSNSLVEELPDSIGELLLLQYLGLYNTQLKSLPESVSNLYNLQTLELGECYKLLELPKGMSNLVNLRHLDLHLDWEHSDTGTDLISMPPRLGRLTSLQTLSRFSTSQQTGCGIGELKDLNLRGELRISKLENVLGPNDAAEANLKNKLYLDRLMLQWSSGTHSNLQYGVTDEEIMKSLHPHPKLKNLWIDNYNGVEFPYWVQDPSFCELETLRLTNCRRCEHLPQLGQLPQLKNLRIEGMLRVKSMGTDIGFPLLEILTLLDMPELERLFEAEVGIIPNLNELFISNCPKLNDLSHLPQTLAKLEIRNCPELSFLPVFLSVGSLIVEECSLGSNQMN